MTVTLPALRTVRLPEGAAHHPVHRAFARIGLDADTLGWSALEISASTHTLGGADCPLDRRLLVTDDVDEYKRWIGAADAEISRGARAATPQRPKWKRPPERLLAADDLDADDRLEVRRAAAAYVWGDSARMQAWRDVIARHAAPFELDVIAASAIALRDGAVLRIAGRATMLVVQHLVLDDGQVQMTADGHIAVGHLEKRREFGGAHA